VPAAPPVRSAPQSFAVVLPAGLVPGGHDSRWSLAGTAAFFGGGALVAVRHLPGVVSLAVPAGHLKEQPIAVGRANGLRVVRPERYRRIAVLERSLQRF